MSLGRVGNGHGGTSEEAWQSCAALRTLPALQLPQGDGPVVVLAPHPDDEALALGGTLFALARQGREVRVVAVTDGEASHPDSATYSPARLAQRRIEEQTAALGRLGVPPGAIVRLGEKDGGVDGSTTLLPRLRTWLRGARVCLAPWRDDGHPDHDATGRAAASVCEALGVPLFEYPVWAWHWADPGSQDLPWARARQVSLSPAARRAKDEAIAAYASQWAPLSDAPGDEAILPGPVLAHFRRPFEVVLQ